MAKDFINDNKVITIVNASPALLVQQKNSGAALSLYQPNDGRVVFVEPQGSTLLSSDLLVKTAQVIETEQELEELIENRRHYFTSQAFSIDTTTNAWTDTNIDIVQGLPYGVYAYGLARVAVGGEYEFTPDGGPSFGAGDPAWADGCDVPGATAFRHLALIGKIGVNGDPFLIGECFFDQIPATAGRLYIRCNDICAADNDGIFRAVVRYVQQLRPTTNAYYTKDNSVYEFDGANWIRNATKTIASELGIGRMVNDDRTLKTYFVDSASSIIYIGQTFGGITESKSNVTGLAFSPETAFVLTSPNGWKFLVYVTDLGEIRTSRVCFESSTPSAIPPQPFVFLADQNLSEQAINDIFTELPLATPDPTQEWSEWALDISNNPGTATSDFTIATDKGWQVYPPLYRLTSNVAQTNEGTSVTFTLRTSILTATIPYTITGITTNDIGGTALNGNFDVVNGLATKTFNIAADQLTEGVETMTLTLAVDSQVPVSQSVQINDTSLTPQGCYTPGQNWVVDGRNLQVCNSITVANISLLNGAALWVPAGVTLTITGVVNSSPNSTIFASGTIAGNVNFGILSPGDPNGGVWPCAQQC